MYLTVGNAMELENFRSLRLIAGENGLNRKITKIGILDYEFTTKTVSAYTKGEFIVTSFLYARNNENLILEAVKSLNFCGASGLAVKNVFFNSLPQQVLDYANSHRFPIFSFDVPIYFEDLIVEFANTLRKYSDHNRYEVIIDEILETCHKKEELVLLAGMIFKKTLPYFCMGYLQYRAEDGEPDFFNLLQRFHKISDETFSAIKYKNGFLLLLSFAQYPENNLLSALKTISAKAGLSLHDFHIGFSDSFNGEENFKTALLQSLGTARVCKLKDEAVLFYENIGIYKLLIPCLKDQMVCAFSKDIIEKIKTYDLQNNTVLLETSIAYIRCQGNIEKTAHMLYQHENTIRYRINTVKNLFFSRHSKMLMFEELAAAVQIFELLEDTSKTCMQKDINSF